MARYLVSVYVIRVKYIPQNFPILHFYQGVGNVNFVEKFAYALNGWSYFYSEMYLGPSSISVMKFFLKVVNGF